jgi:phosphoribosyl-dephospho-CoA transferase
MKAQVHDLLRVDPESVNPGCPAEQAWVEDALAASPWVVVRRDEAPEDQIAVGVRGATRGDRWGGFIARDQIRSIVRPAELLLLHRSSRCVPRTPALRALRQMDERWRHLTFAWGPGGSVGFELVSGQPSTNDSSDLDLIIRAPAAISRDLARSLWDRTQGLTVRVDVRVETPYCGISLEEYACGASGRILLRYPDGPKLGADPWSEHSWSKQ